MRTIDFLSESPKSFIFNKDSNKTLFGGVLSLIFLLIVLLISILYLVDYFINDKYSVEYALYQEILTDDKRIEKENSKKYNPDLGFAFNFKDENGNTLSNDTIHLYDYTQQNMTEIPKVFKKRASDLKVLILYKCPDKNCTVNMSSISCELYYSGYKLDHQGEKPIYFGEKSIYSFTTSFFFKMPLIRNYYWKTIKYNESLGFMDLFYNIFGIDSDNEYIGGNIDKTDTFPLEAYFGEEALQPDEINGTYYRVLGMGQMVMDFNIYDQYKRTKISIFDVIANICSLSMTIMGGFAYFFSNYYSNSYDNYEIIEKILSKKKSGNINKDFDKENIINKESSNTEAILRNSNTDGIDIEEPEKKEEEKLIIKEEDKRTLPKIKFIDFILNNLPFDKCCGKSKSQAILSSCNELISEYYTVEYIIYNQMMLENLLKDYKWNDPSLNNVEANKFINKITSNV